MPPSTGSLQPATSLPSITSLRSELDYGISDLPRCKTFYGDLSSFRGKYITSSGIGGLDLHEWKNTDHQTGLTEMTNAYLDEAGNGPLFWPDAPGSPNYNKWQYSKHRQRIHTLIKQLFFRLNLQQHRNYKYKNKPKTEDKTEDRPFSPTVSPAMTPAVDLKGHTAADAIDIDADIDATVPSLSNTGASTSNPPPTAWRSIDTASSARTQSLKRTAPQEDAYDFPLDSTTAEQPATASIASTTSPQGHKTKRLKKPVSPARVPFLSIRGKTTPTRPQRERKTTTNGELVNWANVPLSDTEEHSPTSGNHPSDARPAKRSVSDSMGVKRSTNNNRASGGAGRSSTGADNSPSALRAEKQPRISAGGAKSPPSKKVPHPTRVAEESPPSPLQARSPVTERAQLHQQNEAQTRSAPEVTPYQLPTPSTISEDLSTIEGRQSSELEAAPALKTPMATGRPVIDFIYRVVLSRYPTYKARRWHPSRKLEEMTFREFMGELNLQGDVIGLVISISGPGLETVEELKKDDEIGFDSLRRLLKKVIRGQLAGRGQGVAAKPLVFELEIEKMSANGGNEKDEADEEDFMI